MSALIPLSFPEASSQTSISNPQTGIFPYAPIGADHHEDQPAADSMHRMQQLEAMLKEVQGRAEIVEKEAYDQAYLAGEKAGMVLGKRRGEQILESLQESLKETGASLAAIQQSFADAAMDVAGFIAKQIIAETVQDNKAKLWDIAQQAAQQLPDTATLTIAVSPDDFFAFKRLLEDSDNLAILNSDPAVENGTCRIISSQQDILVDPVAAVSAWLDRLGPALQPTVSQEAQPEQQRDER